MDRKMNINQERYRYFYKLLSSAVDNNVLVMCYYPSDVKIRLRDMCDFLDELGIQYETRKIYNSIFICGHHIKFVSLNNERAALGWSGIIFDYF